MLPPSIISPAAPFSSKFPPENLDEGIVQVTNPQTGNEVDLMLDRSVFTAYGLVGRRTFLYKMHKNLALCGEETVGKFSYQVVSRRKEEELVALARSKGVSHMPLIYLSADLWKLSDGIRELFFDYEGKRVEYEDRCLRLIVYRAYYPIQELFKKRTDLIPVMADQMLDCKLSPFFKLLCLSVVSWTFYRHT